MKTPRGGSVDPPRGVRVRRRGSALGLAAAGDQLLLGLLLDDGVEEQPLLAVDLLRPHDDRVLAVERAAEQVLGQRVLEVLLDGPAERAGAVLQAGPLLDEELLGV